MAKSLKDILAGVKSSKTEKLDLKDLQMSAGNKDQEDFIKKHSVEKHADRVGNGDEVYKGKTKKADYKRQSDGVYESHCSSDDEKGKMEKAKGKKLLLDKEKVSEGRVEDAMHKKGTKELSKLAAASDKPVTKLKAGKKQYNQLKSTGQMFGGARTFAAGIAKRNIEGDIAGASSVTKAKVGGSKLKEEYIEEKLTAKDPTSKWIHDFVHSDNPKFEGKSKKQRIDMALGAYYKKKRGSTRNEQADTAVRMPGQASATTGGPDLDTVRV